MRYMESPEIEHTKNDGHIKTIEPPWRQAVVQFADAIILMIQYKRRFLPDRLHLIHLIPPVEFCLFQLTDLRRRKACAGQFNLLLSHQKADIDQQTHNDQELKKDHRIHQIEG